MLPNIRFDEESHRYFVLKGNKEIEVPSVSWILSYMNLEFNSWLIPESNFKRGSSFHALTEIYDMGIIDKSIFETQKVCDWWNLYADFKKKWGPEDWEEIEVTMYHPDGFCGRIDRVFSGNLIADYKTGIEPIDNFVPTKRHRQQLALYKYMFHDIKKIDPFTSIIYFDLKGLKWKEFQVTLSLSEYSRYVTYAKFICALWKEKKGEII